MAFTPPTPADLIQRWPQFAAVDAGTIQFWLTDATDDFPQDTAWPIATDLPKALIALAAHHMMVAGVAGIGDGEMAALLAAGVTDFQSGGRQGFRASFSPDAIKQALSGSYANTKPGQYFLELRRRNIAGPRVTAPGAVPCLNDGFNGFAGPLPGYGYWE
jgi:hypothetical protein